MFNEKFVRSDFQKHQNKNSQKQTTTDLFFTALYVKKIPNSANCPSDK